MFHPAGMKHALDGQNFPRRKYVGKALQSRQEHHSGSDLTIENCSLDDEPPAAHFEGLEDPEACAP